DSLAQLLDATPRLVQLRGERRRPLLELRRRFFEPLHLRRERAGALDERRVRRPRVGRALAQRLGRFTRLEQPALRHREPLVRLPLLILEPRDRLARFLLPPVVRVALLFRLMLLARELIRLLREPCLLVDRVLQLSLVADD